ncbi:sulfite reductase subunit alpha [Granulicella arctica]|uniref:sulfite reductase subunit alpha n=1 Tax=Granulicella arctica TaxID=940613 RepID=UPI0021DF4F2E|nr:sulfite reductase subunit alpha [Granulicella arctica]
MSIVPFIPDSAPFAPAQRAWLNGFLAGLYSTAEAAPAAAATTVSRDVAVLYASQTGTSERLAKKIAKELKLKGHVARVTSLEGYAPSALATEECALMLVSTYGEGDPPDPARSFFDLLCGDTAPRLDRLNYSVLALGDSHYEHFCKFGVDLDQQLAKLGASQLAPTVLCDVEVDETFEVWKADLLQRLVQATVASVASTTASAAPMAVATSLYHRDHPFAAELLEKRALTCDVSSKQTLHLAFSLRDSDLTYEAGDALAVLPANEPSLVHEILTFVGLSGEEVVELPKVGNCTISEALGTRLQITRLSRKLVDAYGKDGSCDRLLALLKPEQQTHLDQYLYDRGLIDLLHEYPGVLTSAQRLADLLPKLAPRLYSISSSPKAHAGEVHATVAVVRYRSHNRERGGVCSTMFADRAEVGSRLPVYIQQNKKFRLPSDNTAPIIMIGPGTGIAPFRAFLHERCATNATGRNWLFFGERSAATDFLYREELEQMTTGGLLTRLDTAFSRDQAHKIYVQDRMVESGAELFAWLEEGASVYVCGDAARMAKDVDLALHTVIEQHGGRDTEAAKDYVQNLHDSKRYHRDVY